MLLSRKKIAMVMAEFLGTMILTVAVLAVSKSSLAIPYFIASAAGLAVAVGTMMFASVSGGHFNPAITLGLFSVRRIKAMTAIVYIAAQLLGGFCAYLLFTYFVNQTWSNSGQFTARALVAEAAGAFVFSLAFAAAVYQKYETGKSAAIVGFGLMLGLLVAFAGSGGILNPAVALGLHSWVLGTFVLGPILGAIIGFNLYSLLFAPASALIEEFEAGAPKKKVTAKAKK